MRQFRAAMRELQSSMGFVMDIRLTPMGAQDVGYKFLTLVADKAA